jgi:hypothetical protein
VGSTCRRVRTSGGHLHYGFGGYDDRRNYKGPTIWCEGDAQFRFALELEREFPGCIHLEMPVARFMFSDFDKRLDARQFIDIVVSDLSDFDHEDDTQVFAERQHDAFIEVKYAGRSDPRWQRDSIRKIFDYLPIDLRKLEESIARGRCRFAGVLLVDDSGLLDLTQRAVPWSTSVRTFLLSPTQLGRLDRALEAEVELPVGCPRCGSPRVAAFVFGEPLPGVELQASAHELILGGCELFGDERDPTFGCLDCHFNDASLTTV